MAGAVHFGAAILASFCVACATTVDVNVDQRKDLAGFCTWNFLPLWAGNVRAPLGNEKALNARLTRLLEKGLAERGFTRVTGRPDFYVTFYLNVKRQYVIVSETGAMQTLNGLHSTRTGAESYEIQTTQNRVEVWEIGNLTLLVSDPDEKAVAWRGEFEGRYRRPIRPNLDEAVSTLLGRFSEREPASEAPPGDGGAAAVAQPPAACASHGEPGRRLELEVGADDPA